MDIELKQHLEAMEGRINQGAITAITESEGRINQRVTAALAESEGRINQRVTAALAESEGRINQGATAAIKESENRVVTLITDVKESLEREMNTGFEDMAGRFDAQSNRLDRQAALIQTGSRWTNRMNDWAENVDQALDRKSQEIADLHKRIDKIEGGQK